MAPRVYIGGKPRYVPPEADCVFLGRLGDQDLYIRPASETQPEPEVFACAGIEEGQTISGMAKSYGQDLALTTARRIAEYKGMATVDPIKALFYAAEEDDVAMLKKSLRTTPHYAVLAAYARGDQKGVSAGLDALMDDEALRTAHPDSPAERLNAVDTTLFIMGRFLAEDFPPSTFFNATNDKFRELGLKPRGDDGL